MRSRKTQALRQAGSRPWGKSFTRSRLLSVASAVFLAVSILFATWWHFREVVSPPDVSTSAHRKIQPANLSSPASRNTSVTLEDIEREIAGLSQQGGGAPDPTLTTYQSSVDLYDFLMDMIPQAARGNGAAQYHIYLALEECRAYLGPNGEATLEETTLKPFWRNAPTGDNSLESDAERRLWLNEYHRCKHFVGGSLTALEAALGDALPGDVTEYGAVWFERAFLSGYPIALADMALRLPSITRAARIALLEKAVASGDAQVFLSIFEHALDSSSHDKHLSSTSAWLLVACRAGLDCGPHAYWYRTRACVGNPLLPCKPGESALMYFWSQLSPAQRVMAYELALSIEQALLMEDFSQLPWPGSE